MTNYLPKQLANDVSTLPPQLKGIIEYLAEGVHDTWAAARFAEGWTYGEKRDEQLKTHPSLIPYDQLSEAEKAYDIRTAARTIHLLLDRGYKIHTIKDA